MDSSVNSEKNQLLDPVESAGADTAAVTPDTSEEVPAAPASEETVHTAPESAPMPEIPVISPAPHIRTTNTTRSVMLDVLIALLPA
ncbi:MAG: hypothetical protein J6S41_07540, partial [Clostridia bacterium]|nr:hypothetical protein [Clostridia bacterium]